MADSSTKKRTKGHGGGNGIPKLHLELDQFEARTDNQGEAAGQWDRGLNLVLNGSAGTGKTYMGIRFGLQCIMDGQQDQLVIVRSTVPARDQGFLPGDVDEKAEVYEAPYVATVNKMFHRGDAYSLLKSKKTIKFESTSYLRGIEWDNAIVFVDEMQNLSGPELYTVMTRLGENSRIIFAGDYYQTDLWRNEERQGLEQFLKVLEKMKTFKMVEFTHADIIRSGLVKDFIIQYERMQFKPR